MVEDRREWLRGCWNASSYNPTPSLSTLWLHSDRLFSIKALGREDMSTLFAGRHTWRDQSTLLIDIVMRLWILHGIFNTMGLTLRQQTPYFFLRLEPSCSFDVIMSSSSCESPTFYFRMMVWTILCEFLHGLHLKWGHAPEFDTSDYSPTLAMRPMLTISVLRNVYSK